MINGERNLTDDQMLRRKAEEQLRKAQIKLNNPIFEADATKLLHELQVHQIELEMQNEELLRANVTAETALKKYTMLYDFAPMGYFTLDSKARICDLNFTAAEMLKDKRISLIDNNFRLFVSEDSRSAFDTFFTEVYTSSAKESCKVILGHDKDHCCSVYMEGIVTDDEKKCLLSAVDISGF